MENMPKIGISTSILAEKDPKLIQVDRIYLNKEYVTAIERMGGMPILLPVTLNKMLIDEYVALCDGFVFSGGGDINPLYFNTPPHSGLGGVNSEVDCFQLTLIQKVLESGKPLLGVCRGIQLLNVALGGNLYQDLGEIQGEVFQHEQHAPKYDVIHKVRFVENSVLYEMFGKSVYTNSYHHQAIKRLGKNLRIIGMTDDGVVEAVEMLGHKFCIGVQWHPEMMFTHSDEMSVLFEALVEAS